MAPARVLPLAALFGSSAGATSPHGLLVDLKAPPHMGVDRPRPAVSWVVPHLPAEHLAAGGAGCGGVGSAGQRQQAYQLQVAGAAGFAADVAAVADTGRVGSAASTQVPWPAAPLRPTTVYWWRVRTWAAEGCASEWSDPAKIVTGLFRGNFSAAVPVWADGARYALLRKAVDAPGPAASAHLYVAAAQEDGKEKLLGAYRVYINGRVAGTGPGRGDTTYADPAHTQYDTIDVTALVPSSGPLVVALQGYHSNGGTSARAVAELHVTLRNGTTAVVGTDASWRAYDATALFKPTDNTHGDFSSQPREYIDARLAPTGDGCHACWRLASYTPTGAAWGAAAERAAFSPPLGAKATLPIAVEHGVAPVRVVQVAADHWFFDFGTEIMAGAELAWKGGAEGATVDIRMSEELTSNTSILYPMRTGNNYQMTWTMGAGDSSFEQHEYYLFRYGEVKGDGLPPAPTPAPPVPHNSATCVKVEPKTDEGGSVAFSCPAGEVIGKVLFASYGTPHGECTEGGGFNFSADPACDAASSLSTVETLCVGKASCTFKVDNDVFGGDPCHTVGKGFAGAVSCQKAYTLRHGAGFPREVAAADLPFALTAWVVRYPWRDGDSSFNSSNATLNAVWELCRNTLKVTSLDTTTDSNTRERLPYEADGFITGMSRYALQREYAWQRHSTLHNARNPTWPTEWRQTIPLLAHADWMMTGDTGLAADLWDILNVSTQGRCVSAASGLVDFSHCTRQGGTRDIVDWPSGARDGYKLTDVNTVVNAFTVGSLRALSELRGAAGDAAESARLARQADAVAAAMVARLYDNATGLFVDGLGQTHSAWHAQVFPLFFGVGPGDEDPRVVAYLRQRGMVGSVYAAYAFVVGLYRAARDHGAAALEQMTSCRDNSWCSMLRQGATAVMEAWTTKEKPNLSWSHPWASAPATGIAAGVMGITPLTAGYATFRVRPQPGGLAWASIRVPSLPGYIDARFDVDDAGFTVTVTPPANTHATVCLPRLGAAGAALTVDGKSVAGYADGDYVCVDGVGSGHRIIHRAAGAAAA